MRMLIALVLTAGWVASLSAVKIDISLAEIERALTVARSTDSERARFHERYIQHVDTPFIERVELVSEFRRVVLNAEEQIARGDRYFAYSVTRASDALQVFRRRISIIARVRFHPLNNYVTMPPVTMVLVGNSGALVGVRRDPVYGFATEPRQGAPLLGGVVEASFEAEAVGQATREFIVALDGKELGRVTFDVAALE